MLKVNICVASQYPAAMRVIMRVFHRKFIERYTDLIDINNTSLCWSVSQVYGNTTLNTC